MGTFGGTIDAGAKVLAEPKIWTWCRLAQTPPHPDGVMVRHFQMFLSAEGCVLDLRPSELPLRGPLHFRADTRCLPENHDGYQ